MDEWIKFLAARYAEDWGAARDRELAAGLDTSRGTRDVDAKRAIILLCATETDATGGYPLALRVVRHLAEVYSDDPGYQRLVSAAGTTQAGTSAP